MIKPKVLTFIVTVTALAVVGFFIFTTQISGPVACTLEAKICPDGRAVGRVGPMCEFAECGGILSTEPAIATAKINQSVSVLGVTLTPLLIIQDSRCPLDVVCIQAGTVILKARISRGLGTSEMIFELGQVITTEAESIILTEVSPAPYSQKVIKSEDYRFTFKIEKRAAQ
ncbi:MAG: hypothetical protein AAB706_02005 [Patescibacteria group bacterium]